MDPSPANQQEQSHLLLTPLLISAAGIMATALTLLLYQFILTRFCLRRWQLQQQQQQQQEEEEPLRVAERPREEAMGGIDDKTLQAIPVLAYTINNHQKGGYGLSFRRDQNECAVCLGELQEGEMVRLLPTCQHAFHLLCIDHWFLDHSTCPLCRSLAVSFGTGNVDLNFGSPSCSSSAASASPAAGIEDRPRSNGLLQHCTSLISYSERSKTPLLPVQLKRSRSFGS